MQPEKLSPLLHLDPGKFDLVYSMPVEMMHTVAGTVKHLFEQSFLMGKAKKLPYNWACIPLSKIHGLTWNIMVGVLWSHFFTKNQLQTNTSTQGSCALSIYFRYQQNSLAESEKLTMGTTRHLNGATYSFLISNIDWTNGAQDSTPLTEAQLSHQGSLHPRRGIQLYPLCQLGWTTGSLVLIILSYYGQSTLHLHNPSNWSTFAQHCSKTGVIDSEQCLWNWVCLQQNETVLQGNKQHLKSDHDQLIARRSLWL